MPAPSPLAPFVDPLERLGFPYCITGSVAASVYGEPRLTADIDAYYVPPEETLRLELARTSRGMFNLIHHASQFKADRAWIAPPEYVILRKLEFLREGGSDKHTRDIRFILAATAVDAAFLEAEVARRGLGEQWRAAQSRK